MSLKNLAIKLRSTKCFREGILLFESMWNVLLAGPTGFGNMQRVQPGTALRGLRVDGWQVLVFEVLHDLLGQLCQHSFGQGLLGDL